MLMHERSSRRVEILRVCWGDGGWRGRGNAGHSGDEAELHMSNESVCGDGVSRRVAGVCYVWPDVSTCMLRATRELAGSARKRQRGRRCAIIGTALHVALLYVLSPERGLLHF